MTVKDSSAWSGDLSKANQDLQQRLSELEQRVSKQKACMREKRRQLRATQRSRDLQENSQKAEVTLLHSEYRANKDAASCSALFEVGTGHVHAICKAWTKHYIKVDVFVTASPYRCSVCYVNRGLKRASGRCRRRRTLSSRRSGWTPRYMTMKCNFSHNCFPFIPPSIAKVLCVTLSTNYSYTQDFVHVCVKHMKRCLLQENMTLSSS